MDVVATYGGAVVGDRRRPFDLDRCRVVGHQIHFGTGRCARRRGRREGRAIVQGGARADRVDGREAQEVGNSRLKLSGVEKRRGAQLHVCRRRAVDDEGIAPGIHGGGHAAGYDKVVNASGLPKRVERGPRERHEPRDTRRLSVQRDVHCRTHGGLDVTFHGRGPRVVVVDTVCWWRCVRIGVRSVACCNADCTPDGNSRAHFVGHQVRDAVELHVVPSGHRVAADKGGCAISDGRSSLATLWTEIKDLEAALLNGAPGPAGERDLLDFVANVDGARRRVEAGVQRTSRVEKHRGQAREDSSRESSVRRPRQLVMRGDIRRLQREVRLRVESEGVQLGLRHGHREPLGHFSSMLNDGPARRLVQQLLCGTVVRDDPNEDCGRRQRLDLITIVETLPGRLKVRLRVDRYELLYRVVVVKGRVHARREVLRGIPFDHELGHSAPTSVGGSIPRHPQLGIRDHVDVDVQRRGRVRHCRPEGVALRDSTIEIGS
eukprot:scaffold1102_cov256-Pinguiococcus_pyrenoidosus.AAC.25